MFQVQNYSFAIVVFMIVNFESRIKQGIELKKAIGPPGYVVYVLPVLIESETCGANFIYGEPHSGPEL